MKVGKNDCLDTVYYIASDNGLSLEPLAIRPTIDWKRKRISWENTDQGQFFIFERINITENDYHRYEEEKVEPPKIQFTVEKGLNKGKKIELALLNLDIFNGQLKSLVSDVQDFQSEQELKNYYLNTNFSGY